MFLHLGGDVTVFIKDIIAIIDIDKKDISKDTKEFLKISEEEDFIVRASKDEPKSCVIAEANNESKVFLSPISSSTLLKRSRKLEDASVYNLK